MGVGAGLGVAAAGVTFGAVSDDEGGFYLAFGAGVAGGGIVVVALLAGLIGMLDLGSATTSPDRPLEPGRTCAPVAPDSSWWTCGEGAACTEDFSSCERAVGAPLRQR
jgi:hypothetical protein